MQNAQSIAPSFPPVTSPQIYAHERQPSLPVGPTGLVHKGGVPWHKRLALTKAPSPTAHHVLLVLGSFVSDGESDAWPSLTTLASMTGLSDRAVRKALRALEGANLVTTEYVSGRSSRYRLASTPEPPAGGPRNVVPPPPEPRSPEGTREVTSTREAAALLPVPVQEGVDEKPKAESGSIELLTQPAESNTQICVLTQPAEDRSIDPSTKPAEDRPIGPPSTQPAEVTSIGVTSKPTRHTCPTCGNDWPASYGTKCHTCRGPSTGRLQREYGDRYEANHEGGGAAPVPGKYDGLWEGEDDPKPGPPPLTPEARADLEADVIEKGWRKREGQWVKAWL